jgi:hypothetical protein
LPDNSLQETRRRITEMADRLYSGRGEPGNVVRSIEMLRQEDAACQGLDGGIAWRLSRALFFAGQESPEPKAAARFHAEGVQAGRKATRAAPVHRSDRVAGLFWLGVNLALLAQFEPLARAALHALQARRALLQAIAMDASYHGGGPLRVLARLQQKIPRLIGGGLVRARKNYERAIKIAPETTVTRIYFAELLIQTGERDRARAELQLVLSTPLDPDWAFEIERDQRLARRMLSVEP